MILVAGATGVLGSEICQRLRQKGMQVRALVRKSANQEKLTQLKDLGCELVYGNLKDADSLKAACEGVKTVISTATSISSRQEGDDVKSVDQDGQINLVRAAAAAGAEQFIFVSFPDKRDYPNMLNDAKRAVEKELESSGMSYTIIQANIFMETWLNPMVGFDFPSGKVFIYGEGSQSIGFVSLHDVAQLAAACVGHSAANNKYLTFGGPENLTYRQVVEIFEEMDGKQYEIISVPADALKHQLAHASNPIEAIFTALMLDVANGSPMTSTEIYATFGVQPTSVTDFARKALLKS